MDPFDADSGEFEKGRDLVQMAAKGMRSDGEALAKTAAPLAGMGIDEDVVELAGGAAELADLVGKVEEREGDRIAADEVKDGPVSGWLAGSGKGLHPEVFEGLADAHGGERQLELVVETSPDPGADGTELEGLEGAAIVLNEEIAALVGDDMGTLVTGEAGEKNGVSLDELAHAVVRGGHAGRGERLALEEGDRLAEHMARERVGLFRGVGGEDPVGDFGREEGLKRRVADSSEEAVVGVGDDGDAGVTRGLDDVRESGHGRNPVQGEMNGVLKRLSLVVQVVKTERVATEGWEWRREGSGGSEIEPRWAGCEGRRDGAREKCG
jgi:hypothetical protein